MKATCLIHPQALSYLSGLRAIQVRGHNESQQPLLRAALEQAAVAAARQPPLLVTEGDSENVVFQRVRSLGLLATLGALHSQADPADWEA